VRELRVAGCGAEHHATELMYALTGTFTLDHVRAKRYIIAKPEIGWAHGKSTSKPAHDPR